MLAKRSDHAPVGVAYAYLQQRLALLVEQGDFRSGTFHKTRKALSYGLHTQPKFDLLLDKPVWVNAGLSDNEREIIQLADINAYTAAQACTGGACPMEAYYLWSEISSCMALNWKTHRLPGGGFTVYPRPASYPKGMQ